MLARLQRVALSATAVFLRRISSTTPRVSGCYQHATGGVWGAAVVPREWTPPWPLSPLRWPSISLRETPPSGRDAAPRFGDGHREVRRTDGTGGAVCGGSQGACKPPPLAGPPGAGTSRLCAEASPPRFAASEASELNAVHRLDESSMSVMKEPWFLRGTVLFSGQGALSSPCDEVGSGLCGCQKLVIGTQADRGTVTGVRPPKALPYGRANTAVK